MAHTVYRILSFPLQKMGNRGPAWLLWLILAGFAALPCLALAIESPPERAFGLARLLAGAGAGLLLFLGWFLLLGGILEQNRPDAARLVPGHVRRLRQALFTAWAIVGLPAAAMLGFLLHSATGGIAAAGALAALLAVALRWQSAGVVGIVLVIVAAANERSPAFGAALAAAGDLWRAAPSTAAATVLVACVLVLRSLVQGGDRRHVAAHALLERRLRAAQRLERSDAAAPSQSDVAALGPWMSRPYRWCLSRSLERPGTPMARMMLGLGPNAHWTTHVAVVARYAGFAAILLVATAVSPYAELLPMVVGGLGFGASAVLVLPVLQTGRGLFMSRREQALLLLLPGVPRGGALNRALGARTMAQFVVGWVLAYASAQAVQAVVESIGSGARAHAFGVWPVAVVVGLLPTAPMVLRSWASVRAPTNVTGLYGVGVQVLLAGALALRERTVPGGFATLACVYLAIGIAACAWRWRRMAGEPSALPVGRLRD